MRSDGRRPSRLRKIAIRKGFVRAIRRLLPGQKGMGELIRIQKSYVRWK